MTKCLLVLHAVWFYVQRFQYSTIWQFAHSILTDSYQQTNRPLSRLPMHSRPSVNSRCSLRGWLLCMNMLLWYTHAMSCVLIVVLSDSLQIRIFCVIDLLSFCINSVTSTVLYRPWIDEYLQNIWKIFLSGTTFHDN